MQYLSTLRGLIFCISLSLTLGGCKTTGTNDDPRPLKRLCGDERYDDRGTFVCALAGVAIAGAVAGIIYASNDKDPAPIGGGGFFCPGGCGHGGGGGPVSDSRLKRDIHFAGLTPNGLKLYTFRYLYGRTIFQGVMAQDLLNDPRYKDSVVTTASGYYSVDYSKLGLRVINEREMIEEGYKTLKQARLTSKRSY